MENSLLQFAHATGIYSFMHSAWGWPIIESLHFIGLSLLLGCVGVFDLRMLGMARGIEFRQLHRLVPFGVAGFLLNVSTGTMFLVSAPDQYLYNPAFQTKLGLMLVAGINMLWFYGSSAAMVRQHSRELTAPRRARVVAAISLACWCGVIICGRLITYYRPPYDWCWWC
ncbi:MAG: hypothetical protein RL120_15005 [Gammaproteobacteria bacterium]